MSNGQRSIDSLGKVGNFWSHMENPAAFGELSGMPPEQLAAMAQMACRGVFPHGPDTFIPVEEVRPRESEDTLRPISVPAQKIRHTGELALRG